VDRIELTAALGALARRPDLWATAAAQARALVPRAWWRRWPPSPLPPPSYLRFRLLTMYGDPDAPVVAADLVGYLEWCRRMRGPAR
jgi:hypothetical protein